MRERDADEGQEILVDIGGQRLAEAILHEPAQCGRDQQAGGRGTDERNRRHRDGHAVRPQEWQKLPQ